MKERASSCVRAPMSRHCRAASPSAATVSSACTSGEASPYAPNASPRVWPNEHSRSRMGLVPGALAVLPVRLARRAEVLPRAPMGSLRHGDAPSGASAVSAARFSVYLSVYLSIYLSI